MLRSLQITKLDAEIPVENIDGLYCSFQNSYRGWTENMSSELVVGI